MTSSQPTKESSIEEVDPPFKNEASHVEDPSLFSSKDERRLIWKLDLSIVPLAALTYFVAYLDRNSIGNARLMGLEKDLSLTANQFYNCLTMFFVGYIICMLPGNVCLRLPHVRAPIVIGSAVLLFGAFCAGLGGAQSYATVLVLRIFIGFSQAFIQGLFLYTSSWYKRTELATRAGILYAAATISGAFSGLIAFGVQKNLTKEATGLEPWRWLFIIEGCMSVAVGIMIILVMPQFADRLKGKKTWLLSESEIQLSIQRVQAYNTAGAVFDIKQIWLALTDPKSWLFAVINAGVGMGIGSVGSFLPTFVRAFGFSAERAQLFTIIPYACAFASTIGITAISDKLNQKGPWLMLCLSVTSVGYIILLAARSVPVLVFATCLITGGLYPSVILLASWININTAGFTKRGTTWAMAEIFGQCFSIMGTHVYTKPPRFVKGHAIVLGFLLIGLVSTSILIVAMRYLNKRKEAAIQQHLLDGESNPHAGRTFEDEGDSHLNFKYVL